MRLLFATARTFTPDRIGGAEQSAHTLLELLQIQGHPCEAIAAIPAGWRHEGLRGLRRLSGGRCGAWSDRHNGYVTRRALSWALTDVFRRRLRAFQPDLVLTQLEGSETLAEIALEQGVPTALRVPDVQFTFFTGRLAKDDVLFISNSRFVAERLKERFGISSEIVYPAVRLDHYRTARAGADCITFVNPHPVKGLDLALEIATLLPRRRFLFQEGWPLDEADRNHLHGRLARCPNITLGRSAADMRQVYATTRVLIVPSRGEDSLPRVILEAQASGIPVVARDVGGVGEVLTEGGLRMPAVASAADWAAALEGILGDPGRYATLSLEAERNARRPDFDAGTIVARFLEIANGRIARGAPAASGGPRRGAQPVPPALGVVDSPSGPEPG